MKDTFNREITYLRLSITDLCNLRCRYCMPECGVIKQEHSNMLSEEEMIRAVKLCASLGVKKVRLTGGEPLVKNNILSIVKNIANIKGIEHIALTTNGLLLPKYARELKELGVKSVNISLDTLDKEKYKTITRFDTLDGALKGLDEAIKVGFKKVKINTVLIGGFNDDEIENIASLTLKYPIDVRFIELMPMVNDPLFPPSAFIKDSVVLEKLKNLERVENKTNSVARLYKIPNALGCIGLISPMYDIFCSSCNRIRITADGHIKPCLHSKDEFNIKGKADKEMLEVIKKAILSKPKEHPTLRCKDYQTAFSTGGRTMNKIGG